ncbi:MAG: hypothetical protein QM756_12915 [Polyangiaceae bacterium]
MLKLLPRSVFWLCAASFVAVACGDDDDSTGGTGGATNTGGGTSTGGAKASGGTATTNGGATTANGGSATTNGGATTANGGSATTNGGATTTNGGSTTVTGGAGGSEGGMGGTAGGEGGAGGSEGGMGGTAGGEGGAGGAPIVADALDNGNFEAWNNAPTGTNLPPLNWTVVEAPTGSAYERYNQGSAHQSGTTATFGLLAFYNAAAYTATVSQVVSPIHNGNYTFSIWHTGQLYASEGQYVYAKGYDKNNPDAITKLPTAASESAYEQLTLPQITVTSGKIEVGIYTNGVAGAWSNFDDATLTHVQ